MSDLAGRLSGIVGSEHVIDDRELLVSYEVDWTGRFSGTARLVVRPGTTEEVAEVVAICQEVGAPIVTQGGNTGLVGGSVPTEGEVVLSTRRLDDVEFFDGSITAGAGTTLAAVLERATNNGRRFPVDIAARDSASIGGMIATNAAGAFAARYGPMKNQVLGIEAVGGDGVVIDQITERGEPDLVALLPGSEGTLAVITAARLRTVEPLGPTTTALVAVDGADEAAWRFGQVASIAEAAEIMYHAGLQLVTDHAGIEIPVAEASAYLLLEVGGGPEQLAPALDGSEDAAVAIAGDAADRARLWKLREAHAETVTTVGVPHTLDVKVPVDRLDRFTQDVGYAVREVDRSAAVFVYGHLADADIHVNVVGSDATDTRIDAAILSLVKEAGGRISGEHGLGRAKADWVGHDLSDEQVRRWRELKALMDPEGILNLGVALPA